MRRRPGLALLVVALLALLGSAVAGVPRVRAQLKGSPLLQRLNTPWIRSVDAHLFNFRRTWLPLEALGDAAPVERVRLFDPMGLGRDRQGAIYVSDRGGGGPGRVIWRLGPDGMARVVAGSGRRGATVAAPKARGADLGSPQGLCLDPEGRIYFADSYNHVVLRVEPSGALTRVAGTGTPGDRGDGGPAADAELNQPYDVRFDDRGSLYIADVGNHRIRKVDPDGRISTIAGTGEPGYAGDGGPASAARLRWPYGVFTDPRYGVLIADSGNDRIRLVDSTGSIRTLAGTGRRGLAGDGGPAAEARLDSPQSLFVDPAGHIFVGDEHNHVIRVITPDGMIRRVAGNGTRGYSPDGTLAVAGPLDDVENMIVWDDRLAFSEAGNRLVRTIDAEGRLRTLAGAWARPDTR